MSLKKDILWRVAVVYLGVLLMGGMIVARIIYLQFTEKDISEQKIQKLQVRSRTLEANRGDIRATDGRLLCTSVPIYEVRVDMLSDGISSSLISKKIDSLSLCLATLFKDRSTGEYKQSLLRARREGQRYFLLKRGVNYHQLKALKTFPIFRAGRYKGGLIFEKDIRRIYPFGNLLAARTIGYLTKDIEGNEVGIEGSFDRQLSGVRGMRLEQLISGNFWMPLNNNEEVEPRDGNDIITTIDINIQDVAENALLNQLKQNNAHHGTAVLMEVSTGKIRAIANLERDKNGEYRESYNYAIGESSEPGSTFKLASLMAAIEDGYIDLNDSINTGKGSIFYYRHEVKDTKHGGYGRLSVQQIFEVSSNVGVTKIITQFYKGKERQFIDRLYSMNLNEPLGIEIKGESKPNIKYPGDKYWSGVSLPMISFGYEVKQTPLQILTFYNAVANNGIMVKPMLIEEIQFHGQTVSHYEPVVINPSICSNETIKKAKKMLEGVVEHGTAKNLKNKDYKIAGKTGTAQIANLKYGYKDKNSISYQASFCGYFPAENPRYSCIVVVNAPSNNVYYGNLVAGPIFKEIADKVFATSSDMQKIIRVQNIIDSIKPPVVKPGLLEEIDNVLSAIQIRSFKNKLKSDWVEVKSRDAYVRYDNFFVKDDLVPDVRGMAIKDALYLLENAGLKVQFSGRGTVISQSVPPGQFVKKGDLVLLELRLTNAQS